MFFMAYVWPNHTCMFSYIHEPMHRCASDVGPIGPLIYDILQKVLRCVHLAKRIVSYCYQTVMFYMDNFASIDCLQYRYVGPIAFVSSKTQHCSCSVSYYRQDLPRSSKLPALNLPTGLKINIFAPQGRLVSPTNMTFGTTEGHAGPLGRAKFHARQKFPFLVKNRPTGANPLTNLYSCQGLLYAKLPCIRFYI